MKMTGCRILTIAGLLLVLVDSNVLGQAPDPGTEFWPKANVAVEIAPKTRIQFWGQRQDGEDFDFNEWKLGALVSYRMKQILKPHRNDIDEENEHNLGARRWLRVSPNCPE